MVHRVSDQRTLWLVVGLLGGLSISYFWPHEPLMATATDRNAKFGLSTCPVSPGFAGAGELEGVFILDYLTGRLVGAVLNPKLGKFTNFYFRDVAADFQVNPNAEAQYAMVCGRNQLLSRGRATTATGIVYVAELTSGRCAAYAFPYNDTNKILPPIQMDPADAFPFRESAK